MDAMIAYCGLTCTDCDAYKATQANDPEAVERVASEWRTRYNHPAITAEGVWCDGCLSEERKCFHCAACDIRACGVEHGVANCAHCSDYETCEKMTRFGNMVPHAKETLDAIRVSLQ